MKKICMIIPNPQVKGGIASVVNGYRGSKLEKDYQIIYVESYQDGSKFQKLWKVLKSYVIFLKVMFVNKPDLVHIHSSFGPSFYRKLPFIYIASCLKKPIVNHIHGADFETFYLNAGIKKKKFIEKVYNKCSVLIALSDEWKEKLSLIVDRKKIKVIQNYSILYKEALSERMERKTNYTVLFMGEIGRRKGCYDIPNVVAGVSAQFPDVKFILAGVGPGENDIKDELMKKNLAKFVEFPGWVCGQEKDQLLRRADIFFLPSYNEGMPMSILDAMGYGLPIVSTCIGGIPKIVQHKKNGYIAEPGEVQKFSEFICYIFTDNNLQKKMARASIALIEEKYLLEKHVELLSEVYESCE